MIAFKTMDRNLCVPSSVSDEHILCAWNHIIGNNVVKRIECHNSIKIIHLDRDYLDTLGDEELAEIVELYEDIETEGTITMYLRDPSINWWICARSADNNTIHFEVSFVQ